MTDDDIRRAETDPADPGAAPQGDGFLTAIRDIPRMRSIDDGKVFGPPPPMVSRLGAVTQGCGGVALTIVAAVMLLTALLYGYYVWGPAMMLVGGLALLFGTVGIWRGGRTPLIVALPVLAGLGLLAAYWGSYLPAASALAPLGSLNVIFPLIAVATVLVLAVTVIMHVVGVFYWRRLRPFTPRGLIIWGAVIGFLLVLAVVFHFVQQNQRESWLTEHQDTWIAEAQTDAMRLGANSNVTLGYSFIGAEDEPDLVPFDQRVAELDAMLDADISLLRLSASGDMLFEADESVLFTANTSDEEEAADTAADEDEMTPAERIEQQQALETQFMERVTESGVNLLIADSQYTPYLLVKGGEDEDITWDDFRAYQRQRIEYYADLYQPYAYEIINEPDAYMEYSDIADFETEDEQLDAWIAHTQDLIDLVRETSPDTLVGVSVAPQNDFDLAYYERVLELDIDFVAFRVYQPAQFELIEDALFDYGMPQEHGADLWLVETWYGYCLAPQRSMALDADWLSTTVAFAAAYDAGAVLPNDFGCFVQPGGTLFSEDVEEGGRTEVWEAWRDLIAEWAPED